MQIAVVDEAPGERLRVMPVTGLHCHGHQLSRALRITEQLAHVGGAAVGGEVWAQIDHLLEGLDRLVVLTQFDVGVAQESVHPRIIRALGAQALGRRQRLAKLMLASLDPGEGAQPFIGTGFSFEGALDCGLSAQVVPRIPGLARFAHISSCERDIPVDAVRVTGELGFGGADGAVSSSAGHKGGGNSRRVERTGAEPETCDQQPNDPQPGENRDTEGTPWHERAL